MSAGISTEKTEKKVDYYLETAMDGFYTLEPLFAVIVGLVILVVAIPFFLIGLARRSVARVGEWVVRHTPDWIAEQFKRLFNMWFRMMLIPFYGSLPEELLTGGGRQATLSEYSR